MTPGNLNGNRERILSLDQFRGYTVAGMVLVNYLGDFKCIHPVFSHHNTYFSYADSIMPSFHFAVGFALRLVVLKRLATQGAAKTYRSVVRRCLGLILLSCLLELADGSHPFRHWSEMQSHGWWNYLAEAMKCQFWETLAIIGVTSLWVLPVIAAGARTRILFLLSCAGLHVVLSQLFYFDFMWARPNALDPWWGAEHTQGLDGGPLGFLTWSIPQLVGSLAFDAVASRKGRALAPLIGGAVLLLGVGYGLSCLTTLYNRTPDGTSEIASPVIPPRPDTDRREPRSFLAEPPFVPPPPLGERELNYWMMSKRTVGLSFAFSSTGFALAIYVLFVLLADLGRIEIGVFRTFGQNALAAYIIHEVIGKAVQAFAPGDSPLPWALGSFVIYFGLTYLTVRYLERNNIFLRL